MRIRELTEKDLDQAAFLEKACFGISAWSRQALADAVTDKNALYLVAEEDGILAGYCGVWLSFEEGEIMNVAVREDFRRRGYAAGLLRALMQKAAECGASRFLLEVREGNLPAIRLYESLGFQKAGIRKDFYDSPRENALIMTKEI